MSAINSSTWEFDKSTKLNASLNVYTAFLRDRDFEWWRRQREPLEAMTIEHNNTETKSSQVCES